VDCLEIGSRGYACLRVNGLMFLMQSLVAPDLPRALAAPLLTVHALGSSEAYSRGSTSLSRWAANANGIHLLVGLDLGLFVGRLWDPAKGEW